MGLLSPWFKGPKSIHVWMLIGERFDFDAIFIRLSQHETSRRSKSLETVNSVRNKFDLINSVYEPGIMFMFRVLQNSSSHYLFCVLWMWDLANARFNSFVCSHSLLCSAVILFSSQISLTWIKCYKTNVRLPLVI